jgi:hypothetical protein
MEEVGLFYGHFMVIWYIFPKKNLATLIAAFRTRAARHIA